ncbi:MAG TPA: adenylate/guanylate cyclase domain-containing protein [Acidimicrobiales bacterium]|nr:adenylate/guanylate cyclase domain-containing protein [Acidimicrobiales bacterium]
MTVDQAEQAPAVPDVAEFERAGLYDRDAPDAIERLNLLRVVAARGGSLADMAAAPGDDELERLAAELFFLPATGRLTLAELAASVDIGLEELGRMLRACGLPIRAAVDRSYSTADAELVRVFRQAVELFGHEATLELLRVTGAAMEHVADAAISTFVTTAGAASLADDGVLVETTERAAALQSRFPAVLGSLLRHQLVRLARPNRTGTPTDFEVAVAAVGFIDLVGFTSLAERVDLGQVGHLLSRFEALANDCVAANGGRVVKFVGDAVMFRSATLADACASALDLVDRVSDELRLFARGGVASGDVLVRTGDCFGPVVNLAARVAGVAEASMVLAGMAGRDVLPNGLVATPRPPAWLAGIDHPVVLHRVQRGSAAA